MAKKQNTGTVIASVGAGLAAVGAATAAGYYFYASKDAKKHRRVAAKWATDAKETAMRQIRSLPEIDAAAVAAAVDTALAAYQNVRSIQKEDLRRAGDELKANWRELVADAKREKAGARKASVRKRARAIVRKTARKRPKK